MEIQNQKKAHQGLAPFQNDTIPAMEMMLLFSTLKVGDNKQYHYKNDQLSPCIPLHSYFLCYYKYN